MRIEFTKATKRAADVRSGGICECYLIPGCSGSACGQPLGRGNRFYEHIIQCGAGGDNSLGNCAVLCRNCWRAKTNEQDLPVVAKVKRVRDRDRGIRRGTGRRMAGGRDSNIKITMSRGAVDRRTGEPIGRRT